MESIEQEALRRYGTLDCRAAEHFIEGARWADSAERWVSIKEELPPVGVMVLDKSSHLVMGDCYSSRESWDYAIEKVGITHWRPMPELPKPKEQ